MHICGSFWIDFGTVSVFSSIVKTGPKRIKKWISFGARFLNDFGGFGGVFSGPNRSPRGVSVWLGAPEAGLSLDRSGCVRPSWGPDRLRTPPRSILGSFLDVFWSIFGSREPSKIHFWSMVDFWLIFGGFSDFGWTFTDLCRYQNMLRRSQNDSKMDRLFHRNWFNSKPTAHNTQWGAFL